MKLQNTLCPHCKGLKVMENPVKKSERQICHVCEGNGYIPTERSQWIEDGKALQTFRLQAKLRVADLAAKLNMKPATLTDMEYGRIQPIDMMEVAVLL